MEKYLSSSAQDTKLIAEKFAKATKGHIFALTGELGAGKTIFAQGFAKGLGIKDKIISPTFVLIRQHKIPDTGKTFYHLDLYRLEDKLSIKELGLEEIWSDPDNIVLIEWAEKAQEFLPKDIIKIIISKSDTDKRIIRVS